MEKTLDVYIESKLIGYLSQDKHGQMKFCYSKEWLNSTDAIAISRSLPLSQAIYKKNECRGFFAGVLPEEANRKLIANIVGISEHNDFMMLNAIGGECAGAITLLPHDKKPINKHEYRLLPEGELLNILKKLPRQPLMTGEHGYRLSLAGAQNKIAIHIDSDNNFKLPINNSPSTYIVKPESNNYPDIADNENFCLKLAKLIGIDAVETKKLQIDEIKYLLVRRYDRIVNKDGKVTRLHQEDFCQAMGIVPERKYQIEGGPNLKDCFNLIRNCSSYPALDIQNLLNIIIFNMIIGNNDAHGKNFSLLYQDNKIRLAPAYDILSTAYYTELSQKMAMKFGGEYEFDKITQKNIKKFAEEADLNFLAIEKKFKLIANDINHNLEKLTPDYPQLSELIKIIKNRINKINFIL